MLARQDRGFGNALSDFRTEMDRFFDRFWETKAGPSGLAEASPGLMGWSPAINVHERDGVIHVEAEAPGVDPEQIEVTVDSDLLTIKGQKEERSEQKEDDFYRSERRFGSFLRRVQLPAPVDPERVSATSEKGVLMIDLHKAAGSGAKRIPVSASKS